MNEVLRALKAQKTTRRDQFSNRPVEPEALAGIREAILKTANASNRQSYSVLSLDAEHAQGLRLPGGHVFLFCVDFHRLKRCAERLGADFDSGYLMQFITAQTDISMLAQSAILAAQSLGIDTLLTNEIYHLRLDEVFENCKSRQGRLPQAGAVPGLRESAGRSSKRQAPGGNDLPRKRLQAADGRRGRPADRSL
jgi:nitroreductase